MHLTEQEYAAIKARQTTRKKQSRITAPPTVPAIDVWAALKLEIPNDALHLVLPVPISTNNIYTHAAHGGKVHRHLTNEARAFKNAVYRLATLTALKHKWEAQEGGRIGLAGMIFFPLRSNASRDLGNVEKAVCDSIAEALSFNDKVIDILHIARGPAEAINPRMEIFVWNL